jgi:hypothetical protein
LKSGLGALRLPLISKFAIDAIFAVFPLLLFEAFFAFLTLFAAVAHDALLLIILKARA